MNIEFEEQSKSYFVLFLKNMSRLFDRNDTPELNGDVEFRQDD